jgi:HAMP domain-containing protein
MKTPLLRSILVLVLGLLAGNVSAQVPGERPAVTDRADRLERLERRLNELAERQEQLMRRVGAQLERQGQAMQPHNDNHHPMGPAAVGALHAEHQPVAKAAKGIGDLLGLLFIIGVICNILLAIWIYTDIRKRGEGSGIFIAMALVAGIPAAIIYALTRIGSPKA